MSDVDNKPNSSLTEHTYSPEPTTTPNNSVLVDITTAMTLTTATTTTTMGPAVGWHYCGVCDDEKDSQSSSMTGRLLAMTIIVVIIRSDVIQYLGRFE